MATRLEVLELVEEHAVIRFFVSEGGKPAKIYPHMTKQYGKGCTNHGNFYKFVEQFEK